jgi:hypothetical protein
VDTCDSETATCEATAGADLTEGNAGSWKSYSTDSATTSTADDSTKTQVGSNWLKATVLFDYKIVQTKTVDAYPYFVDGFQYNDASFDSDWAARTPHNSRFDYKRFIASNNIASRIDSGNIDEVWIYAFPYAGLWESTMAGTGAYYCNSQPVRGSPVNERS